MQRAGLRLISGEPSDAQGNGSGSPLRGLIYNVFQLPRDAKRGIAIAVTAASPGAGTSYLVRSLAAELGTYPANRILQVDLAAMAAALQAGDDVMQMALPTTHPGIYEIRPALEERREDAPAAYWHVSAEHRRECIDRLRAQFHFVLFDCPAVLVNSDALGIAPLVDGLLLVVEADRTTKKEISQAEQRIEAAGGRLYGSILNKRKTPARRWGRRNS